VSNPLEDWFDSQLAHRLAQATRYAGTVATYAYCWACEEVERVPRNATRGGRPCEACVREEQERRSAPPPASDPGGNTTQIGGRDE
jgi:hypothetical protein